MSLGDCTCDAHGPYGGDIHMPPCPLCLELGDAIVVPVNPEAAARAADLKVGPARLLTCFCAITYDPDCQVHSSSEETMPENTFQYPTSSDTPRAEAARAGLRRPDGVVDIRAGLSLPFSGAELVTLIKDRAAAFSREAEQALEHSRLCRAWHARHPHPNQDDDPYPGQIQIGGDRHAEDLSSRARQLLLIASKIDFARAYEVTLDDLERMSLLVTSTWGG